MSVVLFVVGVVVGVVFVGFAFCVVSVGFVFGVFVFAFVLSSFVFGVLSCVLCLRCVWSFLCFRCVVVCRFVSAFSVAVTFLLDVFCGSCFLFFLRYFVDSPFYLYYLIYRTLFRQEYV